MRSLLLRPLLLASLLLPTLCPGSFAAGAAGRALRHALGDEVRRVSELDRHRGEAARHALTVLEESGMLDRAASALARQLAGASPAARTELPLLPGEYTVEHRLPHDPELSFPADSLTLAPELREFDRLPPLLSPMLRVEGAPLGGRFTHVCLTDYFGWTLMSLLAAEQEGEVLEVTDDHHFFVKSREDGAITLSLDAFDPRPLAVIRPGVAYGAR